MNNKVHIFETKEQIAQVAAEFLLEKINKKNGFFYLAVSGGNTPKILFEILAEKYSDKIHWEKLRLFWVDERCVSPTHADSNFGMTFDALLKKVSIPEKNIFRIKGENNPEDEAKEYAGIIDNELSKKNNLPFFDLILLGMGDDGHTASIFPDNLRLLDVNETVAVAVHPDSGQKRITLTGKTIKNAGQILFIITGKSKAEILSEILNENKNAEKYPAFQVFMKTDAEIFTDIKIDS